MQKQNLIKVRKEDGVGSLLNRFEKRMEDKEAKDLEDIKTPEQLENEDKKQPVALEYTPRVRNKAVEVEWTTTADDYVYQIKVFVKVHPKAFYNDNIIAARIIQSINKIIPDTVHVHIRKPTEGFDRFTLRVEGMAKRIGADRFMTKDIPDSLLTMLDRPLTENLL